MVFLNTAKIGIMDCTLFYQATFPASVEKIVTENAEVCTSRQIFLMLAWLFAGKYCFGDLWN